LALGPLHWRIEIDAARSLSARVLNLAQIAVDGYGQRSLREVRRTMLLEVV
jgi:hypothetical protein